MVGRPGRQRQPISDRSKCRWRLRQAEPRRSASDPQRFGVPFRHGARPGEPFAVLRLRRQGTADRGRVRFRHGLRPRHRQVRAQGMGRHPGRRVPHRADDLQRELRPREAVPGWVQLGARHPEVRERLQHQARDGRRRHPAQAPTRTAGASSRAGGVLPHRPADRGRSAHHGRRSGDPQEAPAERLPGQRVRSGSGGLTCTDSFEECEVSARGSARPGTPSTGPSASRTPTTAPRPRGLAAS